MTRLSIGQLCHDAGLLATGARIAGDPTIHVASISYDSRRVTPGSLFVALRGTAADGHRYLAQARESGAVAYLAEEPVPDGYACGVVVPDSRAALARVAAAFYDNPSRELGLIGVTGTKGKTTTAFLLESLLAGAGFATGLIGTVDLKIGPNRWRNPIHQTTPESLDVQRYLRQMAGAGVDWAVLETSSHALATHRVEGCAFDLVAITNVTHEHLDFHGSFERYLEAKAGLLERLTPPGSKDYPRGVALNADDPNVHALRHRVDAAPLVTFGLHATADVRAKSVTYTVNGASFVVETLWGQGKVSAPLLGRFSVYNILAALALAGLAGFPFDACVAALEHFRGVPGRLQRIDMGQPFSLVVDYAHNPDSLEQVLTLLREVTAGRLLALFGSAGERDRAKRGLMGGISARLADFAIFTDEDPRREDPAEILAAIAAGAEQQGGVKGRDFEVIADRTAAIERICGVARPGDTVVLCGKGHEQSIAYDGYDLEWDEVGVACGVLARLGYGTTAPSLARPGPE